MARFDFLIKDLPKKEPQSGFGSKLEIHKLLKGQYAREGSKAVFLTRGDINFPQPDLTDPIMSPEIIHPAIWRWSQIENGSTLKAEDCLFIDTETTGLSGGTGTYAFMVGIGYMQDGQFITEQFFLTGPSGEKELVELLVEKIGQFKILISFNGKSYDIPLLETRFILQSSDFPIRKMPHLDLLPLSRRLWSKTLPGCSLQQLEEFVLQSGRQTESDIPGHLIPRYYFSYLRDKNSAPLKNIFYHNHIDILSMVRLLEVISLGMHQPPEKNKTHRILLTGMARLFHELEFHKESEKLYRHCVDNSVEEQLAIREYSFVLKRSGKIKEACELWRRAADQNQIYALIELAKQAEHREKDFASAKGFTRRALEIELTPGFQNSDMIKELHHRMKRLNQRLISESNNPSEKGD